MRPQPTGPRSLPALLLHYSHIIAAGLSSSGRWEETEEKEKEGTPAHGRPRSQDRSESARPSSVSPDAAMLAPVRANRRRTRLWGCSQSLGRSEASQEPSGRVSRHKADVLLRNLGRDGLCARQKHHVTRQGRQAALGAECAAGRRRAPW